MWKGDQPSCGDGSCTDTYCCCQDTTKYCKYQELEGFLNKPGDDNVGTWKIDYENTNSLNPTDPTPMHIGFSRYSTFEFGGTKCRIENLFSWFNWPGDILEKYFNFSFGINVNLTKAWTLVDENPDYWKAEDPNSPPWCRAKAPYYHWATDEPKNFKAVGTSYY